MESNMRMKSFKGYHVVDSLLETRKVLDMKDGKTITGTYTSTWEKNICLWSLYTFWNQYKKY